MPTKLSLPVSRSANKSLGKYEVTILNLGAIIPGQWSMCHMDHDGGHTKMKTYKIQNRFKLTHQEPLHWLVLINDGKKSSA